jgi:orotate phosphoribosyltransferase-like protein
MAAHDLTARLLQPRALVESFAEDIADAQMSLPADVAVHFSQLGDLAGRMSMVMADLLDIAKLGSDRKRA